MGLIEKIFKKPKDVTGVGGFQTFTDSYPVFTAYDGGIYEQELTRASIERFASACSKLRPEIRGNAKPHIRSFVETSPNYLMTWPRFLARAATIYECDTTLCIVPAYDRTMTKVVGLFPLKFEFAEVVEYKGVPWIRFHFANGDTSALELSEVCIVTKFQYESDMFGESNCLDNTMQLIHAQNEAQKTAIKNGAAIRFIGSLTGQVREEDMKKKRERFMLDNLTADNSSGLLLYDSTFQNVKQIEPQSYTISPEEMDRIKSNVYTYFGTNDKILTNDYDEDAWSAFYEGKVEPFAVQLGEGLTKMLFTDIEVKHGNHIEFSANRLEYTSNKTKHELIRDMVDRGIISLNEAREMLQMPPVDGGDIRVIRGEYINTESVSEPVPDGGEQEDTDPETDPDNGLQEPISDPIEEEDE